MKRIYLSVLAVFATAAIAHAQQAVPQGGFEIWGPRGSVALAPTGWTTTDDGLAATGIPFATNTVRRTSTSHGGSYAAEVTNVAVPLLGVLPGLLVLGDGLPSTDADIPGGLPYTSRPASMQLYYKLTGANIASDSAFVFMQLTRTVAGQVQVVAAASRVFTTAASTYTLLSLPLVYQSANTPDTLRIGITSGGAANVRAGTLLTVDDISLTGTATATRDAVADAAFSVFPTTSTDGQFTLASGSQPGLLHSALSVSDATGRVVLRQPALPEAGTSRALDLHAQSAGVYVLRLETATGFLTRKLIVL